MWRQRDAIYDWRVKKSTAAEIEARTVEPTVPEAERIAVFHRAASRSSATVPLFSRGANPASRKTA